jgi:hypothetical protein
MVVRDAKDLHSPLPGPDMIGLALLPAALAATVDPIDLALGAVPLEDAGPLGAGQDLQLQLSAALDTPGGVVSAAYREPCTVDFDGEALRPSTTYGSAGCALLWSALQPYRYSLRVGEQELALEPLPRTPGTSALRASGSQAATSEIADGTPAALHDGESWRPAVVVGGVVGLGEAPTETLTLVTRGTDGALTQWAVIPEQAPAASRDVRPAPEPRAAPEDAGWCDPRRGEVVVCVDLDGEQFRWDIEGDRDQVIPPNRPIRVVVRHPADRQVAVGINGQIGVLSPISRSAAMPVAGGAAGEAFAGRGVEEEAEEEVALTVTEQRFGPRLPGDASVRVEAFDSYGDPAGEVSVEMLVETTYVGAVRLGVGVNLFGAVDARYEARTWPGSQQAEVAVAEGGAMDLDLMLGYAPFLERGGRSARGCEGVCLAPYFGLGILSSSEEQGLSLLKSLHMGLEWEPVPDFSVALTGVARRVDRLPEGVQIGSPAADGDVPTVTAFGLGAGAVLNFSPAFTKLGGTL